MPLEFIEKNWDSMVKEIVERECVPRMKRVADACNAGLTGRERPFDPVGYVVDTEVEGGKTLRKHDYHATVITATNQAMADNAENNSLVMNFHQAGGSTP